MIEASARYESSSPAATAASWSATIQGARDVAVGVARAGVLCETQW
jgi:hypothetical protein